MKEMKFIFIIYTFFTTRQPSYNRILCTSKSEAAVIGNKKNCAVGMLKLTTDEHEASCGLSATAERFVFPCKHDMQYAPFKFQHSTTRRRNDT